MSDKYIIRFYYRPLIQEAASKIWVTFAENERRGSLATNERLPAQIQSVSDKYVHMNLFYKSIGGSSAVSLGLLAAKCVTCI